MVEVDIQPGHLTFSSPFDKDQVGYVEVSNLSETGDVVFKVMTTAPDFYFATPSIGLLHKKQKVDVRVRMLRLGSEPVRNFHCNDQLLVMVLPLPDDYVIVNPKNDLHNLWEILEEETRHQGSTRKIHIFSEVKEWKTTWDDDDSDFAPATQPEAEPSLLRMDKKLIVFLVVFAFISLISD
ncbi:hypothetical protein TPHA_0K00640 [Tetrapisispora phaffii CBS 4417]|uniref:MSP domain-containing protein n=1 Tax=Tetrapisispora phaffii (strain ATCC 24235 / CBS 4417 / NBRC 1672 / NRRL Y-8282 / UCD 70-5) TaxID=1071381 RepID=G8BZ70_TETPH|nr:hypothetical protein TPHA_0K00640 [Tetrapisispora phaffii CBS 4417]CCE65198.1 hypothetical protein TPHA_0K00640 [Tetrapisispora phaffii CBS 4417]